jgi:hypothetical protein
MSQDFQSDIGVEIDDYIDKICNFYDIGPTMMMRIHK